MLESTQSKKIAIGALLIALILVITTCLFVHLSYFENIFGPIKYYVIELENGETWYGQIESEDNDSITLVSFYHFNENNLAQLVSHDSRLNLPKEISRDDIFSIGMLSESSPVLKAIRKDEIK